MKVGVESRRDLLELIDYGRVHLQHCQDSGQ